jgi:hypothetical protein
MLLRIGRQSQPCEHTVPDHRGGQDGSQTHQDPAVPVGRTAREDMDELMVCLGREETRDPSCATGTRVGGAGEARR